MLTGLWINRFQIIIFFCKYIAAGLVIVVIVSGIFFFFLNYISIIRYNMLLLHRILIQYCMIVHYQIYRKILLTTYMNVNFNKMLETLIFQRSYAQCLC